jgi:uncharacterized MAPEG superfamily protein
MNLVHVVIGLALVQFLYFGVAVGAARGRYGVKAPATSGNEVFERYFRVQMNTLELLVILLPSLLLFAHYVNPTWAAGLGAVYLVGRILYYLTYVKDPAKRSLGFALSMLPTLALLVGGLGGAILAVVRG